MSATPFDIGVNSFGEVATDDGRVLDDAETVRLLVEEAALAEASGLDVFSVGEHYRAGHVDSATPVLLAAMATATERIRLGTSVTVLSTNDPVRLYQEFSTLDAVSGGRAQLVLGRASATESFPLFGYDIADYEQLFEEKLELFMRLRREETVTWSGAFRPAAGRPALPGTRRRHRRGGGRDLVAVLAAGRDRTGRGTRVLRPDPRTLRGGTRRRRALRRVPGDGRPQDRSYGPRSAPQPLRPQVRRHAPAPAGPRPHDRTAGPRSRPARAGTAQRRARRCPARYGTEVIPLVVPAG